MPLYLYRCQSSPACPKLTSATRTVKARHRAPRCGGCGGRTRKALTTFGISGAFANQTHYGYERDAWALATGEDHQTPAEVEAWAHARGKEIVAPGWKPKPQTAEDYYPERELERDLGKYYAECHVEDNPDGTPRDIEVKIK